MTKHIGIFGGTFNPVHNGHIQCADFVQRYCKLDSVRLMPCHIPPHRATPGVSSQQRAQMVQLAINGHPGLELETLELDKDSPSYTVESLALLQQHEPDCHWYFIIGMDSLCYLKSWKNWRDILQFAHLLVCQRPGYTEQDGDAPALLQQFGQPDLTHLRRNKAGGIMLLPNPLTDISASRIRQQLAHCRDNSTAVSPAVLNYIKRHRLYQA